jgi:hypothetical protein
MSTQGGNILAFLATAISRREQLARLTEVEGGGEWREDPFVFGIRDETNVLAVRARDNRTQALAHIAANDPESVLRRCAADRKLLRLHGGRAHECSVFDRQGDVDNCAWIPESDVCSTIHLVAEGYGWTEGER